MVAELHAVLNGACSAIVESLRDMGYNIEGRDHQAGRARSFQYLNSAISVFPLLSRYDLGLFSGVNYPPYRSVYWMIQLFTRQFLKTPPGSNC